MAHGRKRCFLVGLVAGGFMTVFLAVGAAWYARALYLPAGAPDFSASAMATTSLWARLPPLPQEAKGLMITTEGSMFTRGFRVSFHGEPKLIEAWVKSCAGITDPKCTSEAQDDGSVLYQYPAGGKAQHAELRHYPATGIVEIYTYWS